ncbi:hypothetical protein FQN54_007184 [Arachnomyces sp. PD_36]|nr:hypothetical protein FQN54_007184 [Arachnomyces sp. PD_36]
MNAWLTDASTIPNHENGAFNPTIDPSATFLNPSPNPSDPGQFPRMFNGTARTASPGFQNPNSVIPSKRPRPLEDGHSMSPRQAPGGLPSSRSQTPHQVPFPGYQPPVNGSQQYPQAPTPYQHLQQPGSANATPSPIVQDFDPQNHQRVHTASPSPFSPAANQLPSHVSPPHSDHGSRVNTPQNSTFAQQGPPFTQAGAPQLSSSYGMPSATSQAPVNAQYNMPQGYPPQQAMSAQQRMYQLQLQNQARQMQANSAAATGRPGSSGVNPMPNAPMNNQMAANPQMAAIRQMQQNMSKPSGPDGFLRALQKFMASRGLPLDLQPIVAGRQLHLMQLYAAVMKLGGSKKVGAANMWPVVAQQLQFPAMQYPTAAQEIRDHYIRNLATYEQAWLSSQQKQFGEQMHMSPTRQGADLSGMPPQISPAKANQGFEQPQQFQQPPQPSPVVPDNSQAQAANGFMTPQPKSQSKRQAMSQQRASMSRPPDSKSPHDPTMQFAVPSSDPNRKQPITTPGKTPLDQPPQLPFRQPIEDPFKPAVVPESQLHGPIVVDELSQLGEDIARLKPSVPSFAELGVIDIHALTMSIRSGIHAEMRVALDTLTTISCEPGVHLSLDNCDDLVDVLIECAEDQAELLAENTAEVSDVMLIPSYEEVVRGCRLEIETLLDVPEFGSLEYELDRAVDRLICITTIIRNFSFYESNFKLLTMPSVVKFFATIIRYLGTRHMLLRTQQNTLDYMKDAVIYLSNVSHDIQLPGKEEALCLLHFLLSFAPCPAPISGSPKVMFSPYNPSIHKYVPAAVDSLAKLLARDDPNRTYYKAIFAMDSTSSPPYELSTRAFGLAICPVPENIRGNMIAISEARKPFLMQGLLAAEILSSLADGGLARSWLESTDGFALNLLRLACLLSTDHVPQPPQRHPHARGAEADFHAYGAITSRGLTVLRRLVEKSKVADNNNGNNTMTVPLGVMPKKENLLGALLTQHIDPNVVRQLCAFAGLVD